MCYSGLNIITSVLNKSFKLWVLSSALCIYIYSLVFLPSLYCGLSKTSYEDRMFVCALGIVELWCHLLFLRMSRSKASTIRFRIRVDGLQTTYSMKVILWMLLNMYLTFTEIKINWITFSTQMLIFFTTNNLKVYLLELSKGCWMWFSEMFNNFNNLRNLIILNFWVIWRQESNIFKSESHL